MSANNGEPGFFGRVLRLPLRLIPIGTPVPIMAGPLRGKRWIFGASNHGWWLGRYEVDKQNVFAKYVRPKDVVYDLGANVGFYSLLASMLVGEGGQVHSFEPFPDNVRQIQRHLKLNHVTNCTIHTCAVSDFDGTAKFEASTVSNAMGHLSSDNGIEVSVVSLDQFVASKTVPPPTVLKVDIEGAEFQMLQGARQVLETYKPMVFLATHTPLLRSQCQEFLTSLGYKLQSIGEAPLADSDETLARFA